MCQTSFNTEFQEQSLGNGGCRSFSQAVDLRPWTDEVPGAINIPSSTKSGQVCCLSEEARQESRQQQMQSLGNPCRQAIDFTEHNRKHLEGDKKIGSLSSLNLVGVQRVLVALALVLELVRQQRLLGAHGGEPDLVVVLVAVLPQPVEAVLLVAGLGRAHAPDDARRHHQGCHDGRCRREEA